MMTAHPTLSAIVAVTERIGDLEAIYHDYKTAIAATGMSYEIIFVFDGPFPEAMKTLRNLEQRGEPIKTYSLPKWFGETTALSIGFERAAGDIILTLPAYRQIEAGEIPRIVDALSENDVVVAARAPRRDSAINKFQAKIFHALLRIGMDMPFNDLGCGVRAFRREIMDEIRMYGDQHRFLPLLAMRRGFRVLEIPVHQADEDAFQRIYPIGVYIRRLLDILGVVFIAKFVEKPLRFFGLIGIAIFLAGALPMFALIVQRLFFDIPIAERPALMLASLLVVLGIQIIGVGLVGELVIFCNSKKIKSYSIEKIIN